MPYYAADLKDYKGTLIQRITHIVQYLDASEPREQKILANEALGLYGSKG